MKPLYTFCRSIVLVLMLVAIGLFVTCSDDKEGVDTPFLAFHVEIPKDWSNGNPNRDQRSVTVEDLGLKRIPLRDSTGKVVAHLEPEIVDGTLPQTRATLVTTSDMYHSIGVFAFSFPANQSFNTTLLPNLMHNLEVQKSTTWNSRKDWPGANRRVKFYAYAPHNLSGITPSPSSQAGVPTLTYVNPTSSALQKDWLVAKTADISGAGSAAVPLGFEHALTAISFTYNNDESNPYEGRCESVVISGAYGIATYNMDGQWINHTALNTFIHTNATSQIFGTDNDPFMTAGQYFLMIPQTTPTGTTITLNLKDADPSDGPYALTGNFDGQVWPKGVRINYRLAIEGIALTTRIELVSRPGSPAIIKQSPDFDFYVMDIPKQGAQYTIGLRSYYYYHHNNHVLSTVPYSWSLQTPINPAITLHSETSGVGPAPPNEYDFTFTVSKNTRNTNRNLVFIFQQGTSWRIGRLMLRQSK